MNTQLTRFSPFREMEDLQNRLETILRFGPASNGGKGESVIIADWSPRVDITEDEREFLLKLELPEMKKEEVKVSVADGALTVSGERKFEKEDKTKKYHRIEREYGSFVRSFTLPAGTSGNNVAADFKDGVLRIHLPKDVKALTTKAIEIKAG